MEPASPGTTDSKRRRRSLRRRLVWIAISLAAAVLLGAVLVREVGLARVSALQKDIRARGGRATIGDYLADIRVDPALQEEYRSWEEGWDGGGKLLSWLDDALWSWALSTSGEPPPRELLGETERQDAYFEEGRALLASPSLSLSFRAFAKLDCPENASMETIEQIRRPSWFVQAELARWLTIHALLADDSAPWLDDLDALLDRQTGQDISAYHFALSGLRETAYLLAAIRGKATPERLSWWAGEPFHWEAIIRWELVSDRCLVWAPAVRRDVFGESIGFRETDAGGWYRRASDSWAGDSGLRPLVALFEGAWEWMVIPYDVARGMEWTWRAERQLEGKGFSAGSPGPSGGPYLTAYGRLCSAGGPLFHAETWRQMRALRLAALIIHAAVHESRGLPADSGEVESRWPGSLAGRRPGDLDLFYHQVSVSTFLISTSAAPPGNVESAPEGSLPYRLTGSGWEFRLPEGMVPAGAAGSWRGK